MRLASLVLAICFAFCSTGMAQRQDWLPVSPPDWDIREVPGDPGASAIQLYYAEHINDPDGTTFIYRRIKLLSEKALRFGGPADVEILVPPDSSVSELKARTLHRDGTIVDFTGKPFEKVVEKAHGVKYLAKTFTFPDVTVGSILEYKYVLDAPTDRILPVSAWNVQHSLFTVQESLMMTPYLEGLEGFMNGYQVSAVSTNLFPDMKLERKGRVWELNAQNIPAFQAESYMPPEDNYKPEVRFFYVKYQSDSDDQYWHELGKILYEESERFIGNHVAVRQAAQAAIGAESSPEGKLRRLYDRSQRIRNLSFERERSEEEIKKEALRENENAADVLVRGYGSHNEINRLFVGMARAVGLNASILAASDRTGGLFSPSLLSRTQLGTEIAVVTINGRALYLDPGTKFCPFGLLPWAQTSTQALKLDKKGGELVVVPEATQDKAAVTRSVKAVLNPTGVLRGQIVIQYQGSEALERRLAGLRTDAVGRKKMLEDELNEWLISGAIVSLTGVEGWDDSKDALTATFDVEVPGYASVTGKRLLIPVYLFQTKQVSTFKQSQRRFPVYFPHAFSEIDQVAIVIPAGFSAESVPQEQDAGLPYARYQIRSQMSASQLVTQRNLLFNGIFFPLERYAELREFFNKVGSGDEQQAVMREGSTRAQNTR
jgi:hypothetical protein